MLTDLDDNARRLAEYMSELSELTYCAGWMEGLEFELWRAVESGPRNYGQCQLTEAHIGRLKELAALAGGWVMFDDDAEETFVPRAAWNERFAAWQQAATAT